MAEQVLVLEQAAIHLENGRVFYEKQRSGLGVYFFTDSIIADIESLGLSAGIHAIHYGVYRMLAKLFSFAIYYNLQNGAASVIAILDVRRDPIWAHGQVESR